MIGLLVAATALKAWPLKNKRSYPSSFGVAVQLGDNHTSYIHTISKRQSLVVAGLTDRRIHDKHDIAGLDRLGHLDHFIKKFLFLFVSSRGIHDDDFEIFFFEVVDAILGDGDGIGFCVWSVKRYSDFGGILTLFLTCLSWSKAPALNVSAQTRATFHPFF